MGRAPGAPFAAGLAVAVFAAMGCGRSGEDRASAEAASTRVTPMDGAAPATDYVDAGMVPASDIGSAPDSSTAPECAPGRAFDAYAVPDDVVESVSLERCKVACDNAKRVTLNELPADIAPSMREAIEHAMTRECPRRCVERASVASVHCIESARTALELAACPR